MFLISVQANPAQLQTTHLANKHGSTSSRNLAAHLGQHLQILEQQLLLHM
jgi:hypothetical protein